MSDLAAHLAAAEAEGEAHQLRLVMKELRDFLAGALCTVCGEPLGHDEEIIQDDDRTMHKRCEKVGEYNVGWEVAPLYPPPHITEMADGQLRLDTAAKIEALRETIKKDRIVIGPGPEEPK